MLELDIDEFTVGLTFAVGHFTQTHRYLSFEVHFADEYDENDIKIAEHDPASFRANHSALIEAALWGYIEKQEQIAEQYRLGDC
jgi:hypothetical protein